MTRRTVSATIILVTVLLLLYFGHSFRTRQADAGSPAPLAPDGDGTFFDGGQSLGNALSVAVALDDLDGDGSPDAYVANDDGADRIYLNNGAAWFAGSGQSLGGDGSQDVALGDLDGDGDLDAVVVFDNGPDHAWFNDGDGAFSQGAQSLGASSSRAVALGDLDGDGDLDIFVATDGANLVWINQGGAQGGLEGQFVDSGQALGASSSFGVALGDLDGDADLDAFVANGTSGLQPDKVWLNDGDGSFIDSGQSLGNVWSYDVALGDLDGDADLDAFTASWFPNGNKVWLNDGDGSFTDSGQTLGSAASLGVALGDVDGDGDLDAVSANNTPDGMQVWLNDGDAAFGDSGQTLGDTTTYDAALADLDGDGDLDIFAANFGPNGVWFNGAPGLPPAVFDVERGPHDGGGEVTYWSAADNAMLPVLLGRPAAQALDVHVEVQTTSGVTGEVIPFAPGDQLKFLELLNPQPNPSSEADLTLSVTVAGGAPTPSDVSDELKLVFVDGEQGLQTCILCYVEWLGRLVGVDSSFGAMHHYDLPQQEASPQWDYYTTIFDHYSPQLSGLVAAHPRLLWNSVQTLDAWNPAVQSLEDGSGAGTVISQSMVDDAEDLLQGLEDEAAPGLQALIRQERNAANLPDFVGLNMDQAWQELQTRRPIEQLYFTIIMK